jgi:hypothetical protein
VYRDWIPAVNFEASKDGRRDENETGRDLMKWEMGREIERDILD